MAANSCKACKTPLSGRERHCPNCGRVVGDPGASGPASAEIPLPLGPSSARPAAPAELELEEEVGRASRQAPGKPAARKGRPAGAPASGSGAETLVSLDPADLRRRVVEQPELLEPGLGVLCDAKGKPIGEEYETDVGPIDLLASDAEGSLVVVMVSEGGAEGEIVGEALERVGWVAKHVAKPDQDVRAIVLLDPDAPELGYAARAVADTIRFKTCRLALAFDDVAV